MKLLSLILCLCLTPVFAGTIPAGQWQCSAFDDEENDYEALGASLQEAMQSAEVRCKRQSPKPHTCKTAQSFCEQGLGDLECLVTDETGRSFRATGSNACKDALEQCNEWEYLHGIESQCLVKH
jgi:hypothetical protein